MKLIIFLLLILLCTESMAQDSLTKNYLNFNKRRGMADNTPAKHETELYKLEYGDTLVRKLDRGLYTDEILAESSYLHGKRNGLSIGYYPNGVISFVNYYVDDKLWEVISRSDSSGKLINPGTIHGGMGRLILYSDYEFDSLGYETYKNGRPEGKFILRKGHLLAEGDLTYKKSAVNYLPGKWVIYSNSQGIVDSSFFTNEEYAKLFLDSSGRFDLRALSTRKDSALEDVRFMLYFPWVSGFEDPAIIPKGKWTVTDMEKNRVVLLVVHDENGNPIKVVVYKENGGVLWSKEFPPCKKRKQIKVDQNGALIGEFCPI